MDCRPSLANQAKSNRRETTWQRRDNNLKAQIDSKDEASLRGHLKAEGAEQTSSQSYVPPNESDDKPIKMGLDLLRGTATNAAFPPNPKAAIHN
jgi:carboxyl-terminal processing protease